MKLVAGEFRDDDFEGNEVLKFMDLTLHCKDEQEFFNAHEKIKDVKGVIWCGCPEIQDDGKYIDMVATVYKVNKMSNHDVYLEIRDIRDEIESILKIGKHRPKRK